MVFQDVLDSLVGAQREAIDERLRTLSGFQRIGLWVHANLFREPRLPSDSARAILARLENCDCDGHSIRTVFEPECRLHTAKGPPMAGARPGLLGRAVPVSRFCHLLKDLGLFVTTDSALTWLHSINSLTLAEIRHEMRHIPLGRYLIWATYCAAHRAEDPFRYLPSHPDHLQDALGLPLSQRGEDLFLFVYSVEDTTVLRFPTVADAGWNDIFLPAPDVSTEAGQTLPTLTHPELHPQPEVVHEPVSCERLALPIRTLFATPTISI